MSIFPLHLPEELKERYAMLDFMVQALKAPEVKALSVRLKKLRSEALKRSLDWRASGPAYARDCEVCKGTGHAHFCVDPFCHPEDETVHDDCLHFTPHELEVYVDIHRDYLALIIELSEIMASGISPEVLVSHFRKNKKTHEAN